MTDNSGRAGRRGLRVGVPRSRTRLVLTCFLAIAAFFMITEHTAHVFGALPYLLLLLCPLLHMFGHGGHGGQGGAGHAGHARDSEDRS